MAASPIPGSSAGPLWPLKPDTNDWWAGEGGGQVRGAAGVTGNDPCPLTAGSRNNNDTG